MDFGGSAPVGHHDTLELFEDLRALLDQIRHDAISKTVCLLPHRNSSTPHSTTHTVLTLQGVPQPFCWPLSSRRHVAED